MSTSKILLGLAGAVAIAGFGVGVYQSNRARESAAAAATAGEERAALLARLADAEERLRRAEVRVAEAEKDGGELLKAVANLRSAGGLPASRERVIAMVGGAPPATPAEQEQLAQERAYQQDLARKRARDARRRAEVDEAGRGADPEARFSQLIAAGEQCLAAAEFQEGIRFLQKAMAEKPTGLAISERVRQLQAALLAQQDPVVVPLRSDGQTFVTIANQAILRKFEATTVSLPPGDYEVTGRRSGFQEVRVPLQLRAGDPVPNISVVCTQPAGP